MCNVIKVSGTVDHTHRKGIKSSVSLWVQKNRPMLLHIDDTWTVSDVQDAFSRCFPGLRISFTKKGPFYKETAPYGTTIEGNQRIGAIRKTHGAGYLEILSWYTVARLEKEFREQFGLPVQVFRKEQGKWMQTSSTDNYTLRQQSEMAQQVPGAFSLKLKERRREYEYL
jgi:hypothetical protein